MASCPLASPFRRIDACQCITVRSPHRMVVAFASVGRLPRHIRRSLIAPRVFPLRSLVLPSLRAHKSPGQFTPMEESVLVAHIVDPDKGERAGRALAGLFAPSCLVQIMSRWIAVRVSAKSGTSLHLGCPQVSGSRPAYQSLGANESFSEMNRRIDSDK